MHLEMSDWLKDFQGCYLIGGLNRIPQHFAAHRHLSL